MGRKKPRKCCACRKSPVWRGGDVKDPGPFCKKCYHKRGRQPSPGAKSASKAKTSAAPFEPDYNHCPECGVEADVLGGEICPRCHFHFSNALYWWFA